MPAISPPSELENLLRLIKGTVLQGVPAANFRGERAH